MAYSGGNDEVCGIDESSKEAGNSAGESESGFKCVESVNWWDEDRVRRCHC
jgi:hypothetical protein